MRVMVYVKNQEQIRAHDGERVYGTFFAPYDHSLEPCVRIAVGDYISLVEKRGEMNAAYALLECLAHELTHYYQWLAEWEMNNVLEEKASSILCTASCSAVLERVFRIVKDNSKENIHI